MRRGEDSEAGEGGTNAMDALVLALLVGVTCVFAFEAAFRPGRLPRPEQSASLARSDPPVQEPVPLPRVMPAVAPAAIAPAVDDIPRRLPAYMPEHLLQPRPATPPLADQRAQRP